MRSSDPDPGLQIMTEVTSHIQSLLIISTPRGAGCLTIFIFLTANKTAGKLNALKFNEKFVNRKTFDCKERALEQPRSGLSLRIVQVLNSWMAVSWCLLLFFFNRKYLHRI